MRLPLEGKLATKLPDEVIRRSRCHLIRVLRTHLPLKGKAFDTGIRFSAQNYAEVRCRLSHLIFVYDPDDYVVEKLDLEVAYDGFEMRRADA